MSGGRRMLLVVALAAIAVVPLRAFGVVGPEAPGGLAVSATLGGCGVAGDGILCEIRASFGGVEGADYYTASVTRADGSVQDAGSVGTGEAGGSTSIYVPYVGAGVYSVTISAWGTAGEDDAEAEPELLERDTAEAQRTEDTGKVSSEPAPDDAAAAPDDAAPEPAVEPPPAEAEPAVPEPQTLPECQPDDAAEAAPAPADAATATDLLSRPVEGDVPAEAPPAPAIECIEPSSDAGGPCCPPGA